MAAYKGGGELKMTDKSYFRAGKNERIAARDKAMAESQAKEEKIKSELDDPAHYRYRKNKGITGHGTTTAADLAGGKKEEKELPVKKVKEEESPKEIKKVTFTEAGAKKLNRTEQTKVLNGRGIKVYSFQKEAVLVKKIIESNP